MEKKVRPEKLFSIPLFKESIKSNAVGWSIVTFGNAVLAIVVVLIMSSLNINATKDSLGSMLEQADMEATVKMGAAQLDLLYEKSGEAYLLIDSNEKEATDLAETLLKAPSDQQTQSAVSSLQLVYDLSYLTAAGNEDQKHETAKEKTSEAVIAYVGSDLDQKAREAVDEAVSVYLDDYRSDKSEKVSARLFRLIPEMAEAALSSYLGVESDGAVSDTVRKALDSCYDENMSPVADFRKEAHLLLFSLASALLPDEFSALADPAVSILKEAYLENTEAYENDEGGYHSQALSEALSEAIKGLFDSFAYYNYLLDFRVSWLTDETGRPYVRNEDGTVGVADSYQPESFISVKEGMEPSANLLQKMNKKALTGEDYAPEEIAAAQKEASSMWETFSPYLSSYLADFATGNTEAYLTDNKIDPDKIEKLTVDQIVELGSAELIRSYEESTGEEVSSLDDILDIGNGMDGRAALNMVVNYSVSGIASFKALFAEKSEKYDLKTALLVALVYSSKTVTNSLPGEVDDSLIDITEMNMYEMVIGCIGFGIACLLIPMVYAVIRENSLVAQKVESGSLAFTLSTPLKRSAFALTEAVFSFLSVTGSAVVLFLFALIGREIGIAAGGTDLITSLPIADIAKFSFGNYLVVLASSGICYLSSCFFNKTSQAIGVGGGITVFFFVTAVIGLFGNPMMPSIVRIDALNAFNYMTIVSLFDGKAIMDGSPVYWYKLLGLVAIAFASYGLAIWRFDTKDLPL